MAVRVSLLSLLLVAAAWTAGQALGEEPPTTTSPERVPFADIPLYEEKADQDTAKDETETTPGLKAPHTPEGAQVIRDILYINDLGDVKRIVFEGVAHFSEDELRGALAGDLKYQAAARPSNETSNFLEVLEARLREGYLHSGCPEARVSAWRDSERRAIVVRVNEGPRLMMGNIHVSGAAEPDRSAIVEWLTTPQSARPWKCVYEEKPVDGLPGDDADPVTFWTPGKPVDYRKASKARMEAAIRLALVEAGLGDSAFHFEMKPDAEGKAADLQIFVLEARRAVIGDIEVSGLERDTKQALLDYLELAPGETLDAAGLKRISDRLAYSCRYWKHDLVVALPSVHAAAEDDAAGSISLRLDLEEYAAAPPLGEPLRPEEEVLRKAAAWIESLSDGSQVEDLVFTAATGTIGGAHVTRAALSADGSLAVEARVIAPEGWRADHAIVVDSQGSGVYDWKSSEKLFCSRRLQPRMSIQIRTQHANDGEQQARLLLSYAFTTANEVPATVNAFDRIRAEPVALMQLAHGPKSKSAFQDGILTLTLEGVELQFCEETGALRSIQRAALLPAGISAVNIETRAGAVEELIGEIRQRGADVSNRYDEAAPATSVLGFALDQLERQPAVQAMPSLNRFCHMAQLSAASFQKLSSRWHEQSNGKSDGQKDAFRIPSVQVDESDWLSLVMVYGPFAADISFPRASWPWTLCREFCFLHQSGGAADDSWEKYREMAGREFGRLLSCGERGPIGELLTAKFLQNVLQCPPHHLTQFTNRGLADLSEAAFLKDVRLLTDGDHGLAVVCRSIAEQLGQLKAEDQELLLEMAPEAWRDPLQRLVERRNELPDEPPGKAIVQALLESWNAGLREAVEAELRRMTTQTAQSPAPEDASVK